MTSEQLDEIEKLAEAANAGPWARTHSVEVADLWAANGAVPILSAWSDVNIDFIAAMREYALPLVWALREAQEALAEREGDMHARIRAGYDKTVADMWRAHCAKIEKERDAACAEIGRLRVENKFLRERPIPEGRVHQAMTGYVMDLRALVLDHEWVTDGRECVVYCLWCKQTESNGHAEACEMFGPGGLIPIDPKTKRPAPVKSLRERGCQCQWEAGDSACLVHGEESK